MVASQQQPRPIRWVEEADDPELEERLVRELAVRRDARRAERVHRAAERRSRRLFLLFALVTLALVAAISYGAYAIGRGLFG